MSFHTNARKVRKTDLPFTKRRAAFRSCIESYIWLIKGKFNNTYTRFSNHFDFDTDVPGANDHLSQAMEKEKMRGRRSPSKSAVEALYNPD